MGLIGNWFRQVLEVIFSHLTKISLKMVKYNSDASNKYAPICVLSKAGTKY